MTDLALVDEQSLVDVLQMSDTLARVERVAAILLAASPDHLDHLKRAFQAAALDRGDVEYVLFIDWWARFDPIKAYAYTQLELRFEYPRTVLTAARAWARFDPEGAAKSGAFFDPGSRSHMYRGEMIDAVIVGWFESGKPGLEAFLASLETNSDIGNGMRAYARMRVLRDGARETLEWTQEPSGFPAVHHRLLIAGALTLIAHQDPGLAVEWLPIAKADGIDIRTFLPRIAGAWAHHEPKKAMEWLSTLPADAERERAIRRAGERWSKSDSQALASWLETNPDDDWLDVVRLISIRSVVLRENYRNDWAETMRQSELMVGEAALRGQRIWTLRHWLMVEPVSAEAWIESHRDEMGEDMIARAHEISMGERTKVEKALAATAPGAS